MLNRLLCLGILVLAAGCCCPGAAGGGPATAVDEEEPQQVFISMTTVRIPARHVDAVLGALCPKSAAQPRALSQEERDALWKAWQDDGRVQIVQAPKLLALDGQEATIFIGETIRFAETKPETKAETNEQGGLEFSIRDGPVRIGYQLRVRPQVTSDGARIALDVHEIERRMKKGYGQSEIAAMDQDTFMREVVIEDRLDVAFDLPDAGHVLLGSPAVREDDDGRYVRVTLLNARVLQEAQAQATSVANG